MGRILNEAGVKVAMKPAKTVGNILTSPKDPTAEHEKSRLVYKIPCADCGANKTGFKKSCCRT